jgi:hypothetical protein
LSLLARNGTSEKINTSPNEVWLGSAELGVTKITRDVSAIRERALGMFAEESPYVEIFYPIFPIWAIHFAGLILTFADGPA